MRRAGLRTRIARLQRQGLERGFPQVFHGICDKSDADIVGIMAYLDGQLVEFEKLPGEEFEQLNTRAFKLWPGVLTIAARYRHILPQEPPQRDYEPLAIRMPESGSSLAGTAET